MTKKRLVSGMLALIMTVAVGLTGCHSKDNSSSAESNAVSDISSETENIDSDRAYFQ